jgi:hypothetical protein
MRVFFGGYSSCEHNFFWIDLLIWVHHFLLMDDYLFYSYTGNNDLVNKNSGRGFLSLAWSRSRNFMTTPSPAKGFASLRFWHQNLALGISAAHHFKYLESCRSCVQRDLEEVEFICGVLMQIVSWRVQLMAQALRARTSFPIVSW